jgi:hypothetical protein
MTRLTSFAAACALAVAVGAPGVLAQATSPEERAIVEFNTPVEVPGGVLPAGTYLFVVPDMNGARSVVQVFDEEQSEILGQWHFIEAERPDEDVTDETLITFRQDREGGVPAVQFWFAPGERVGREFLYPEDQAREITARTGQPVRSSPDDAGRSEGSPAAQD